MHRWIIGMAIGAMALGMAVGGCGSGSETSSSLTKAEFVKQASQACAKWDEEWQAALASYGKELSKNDAGTDKKKQAEIAAALTDESILPALEEQLAAFEELGLPVEGKQEAAAVVHSLSSAVKKVKAEGAESVAPVVQNFEKEATDYGLSC